MPRSTGPSGPVLTRRSLLVSTAAAVGASAIGSFAGPLSGLGVIARGAESTPAPDQPTGAPVPFDGTNQAGIVTPAQDRLAFAAFDLTTTNRDDIAALLQTWTAAARAMTAGLPVGDVGGNGSAPPVDTGEALGLPPARLTVTFGVGPSLFDGRFGLEARRPAALADLPSFPGDLLEPELSDGDLCIQACSDDPQVGFHAVRNLARLGRGAVTVRWFQLGFGRTSSTSSAQVTPRNLMGFKDGTNNIVAEDTDAVNDFVWVDDETDQPWMLGGSYLVTRRIRMRIESWDRAALDEQEAVIGRSKVTGAPIGSSAEHDPVDLAAANGGWHSGDSGRCAHPPGSARDQCRRADPEARLFIYRRHRPADRRARRRALLHLLPARPALGVRGDPAAALGIGRAQRISAPHREWALCLPAWNVARRLVGTGLIR